MEEELVNSQLFRLGMLYTGSQSEVEGHKAMCTRKGISYNVSKGEEMLYTAHQREVLSLKIMYSRKKMFYIVSQGEVECQMTMYSRQGTLQTVYQREEKPINNQFSR